MVYKYSRKDVTRRLLFTLIAYTQLLKLGYRHNARYNSSIPTFDLLIFTARAPETSGMTIFGVSFSSLFARFVFCPPATASAAATASSVFRSTTPKPKSCVRVRARRHTTSIANHSLTPYKTRLSLAQQSLATKRTISMRSPSGSCTRSISTPSVPPSSRTRASNASFARFIVGKNASSFPNNALGAGAVVVNRPAPPLVPPRRSPSSPARVAVTSNNIDGVVTAAVGAISSRSRRVTSASFVPGMTGNGVSSSALLSALDGRSMCVAVAVAVSMRRCAVVSFARRDLGPRRRR